MKIKGVKIHYSTWGNKENPPLLYLHGLGSPFLLKKHRMDKILRKLSTKFYVMVPEHPGLMRSGQPKNPWTINDYMDYINIFIKAMKVENPIIMGHSFGGMLASVYAAINPNNVRLLVLIAPAVSYRDVSIYEKIIGYSSKAIGLLLKLTLIPQIVKLLAFLLLSKPRKNIYKKDFYKYEVLRETLTELIISDFYPLMKKIKTPTIIIWGTLDPFVPYKVGRTLHKLIKNSELHTYLTSGHLVIVDKIEDIIYLMDRKLTEFNKKS